MPTSSIIGVKICGLTSPDAIDAAVRAGAAYGGLVFHPKSPRFVKLEQAAVLAGRMRGRLKIVALIADMDDAGIEAVTQAVKPDFLQLHGSESGFNQGSDNVSNNAGFLGFNSVVESPLIIAELTVLRMEIEAHERHVAVQARFNFRRHRGVGNLFQLRRIGCWHRLVP